MHIISSFCNLRLTLMDSISPSRYDSGYVTLIIFIVKLNLCEDGVVQGSSTLTSMALMALL